MQSSGAPSLSIIVPTRERADTLVHTIRTLVTQDFEDCEILISDNASTDNTRQVVDSFPDERIRYINTGERVSMSQNWEFALRHARGDFVTYLGDDDGFIPGAITKAMGLLEQSRMNALIWDTAAYHWPSYVDESLSNWITLRVGDNQVHVLQGRRMFARLMRFRSMVEYRRLPCPYLGIVRRSLFEKVTDASTNGVFFNSISPDVFSAIALSTVVGKYLLSEHPFSVSGASGHSTGNSFMRHSLMKPDSPASRFVSEVSLEYDPRVKMAPSIASITMGEYLLAMKSFPGLGLPEPEWRQYILALIRSARNSLFGDEVLQSAAHTVRVLGLTIKVPDHVAPGRVWHPVVGLSSETLNFKVPPALVNNIYDACQLVSGMLPASREGDIKAPVSRFIRNLRECFIAEAKTLYRSY